MTKEIYAYLDSFYTSHIVLKHVYEIAVHPGSRVKGEKTSETTCGMVIPIQGKAKYKVNHHTYTLEKGQVLFAGAGLPLEKSVIGDQDWVYCLMHYAVRDPGKDHPLVTQDFCLNIGEANVVALYRRIQDLSIHQPLSTPMSKMKSKSLFMDLIYQVFEYANEQGWDTEQDLVDQAMQYMGAYYYRPIMIAEMAERFGMTDKRFCYVFGKVTGISPKKYLTNYRMTKAVNMLLLDHYSVGEIAYLVGYEDAFNFSRMFKKFTGMSPSHFKDSLRKMT